MILEARELTIRYAGSERPALDAVSCTVDAGELLAVVGPNGSGKTTLLRGLLGLVEATSGQALIQDRSIDQWRRTELAHVIGVVTQREENVFPLRVAEVVMLGRYAKLGPLAPPRSEDLAAVERAMARCDVADLSTRYVDTLSGGEWRCWSWCACWSRVGWQASW
jgi:ABC-type cobalamin/Fe3+-siderophores transport system ATPase subunit